MSSLVQRSVESEELFACLFAQLFLLVLVLCRCVTRIDFSLFDLISLPIFVEFLKQFQRSRMSNSSTKQLVVPGTIVTHDTSNFMRGRGTYYDANKTQLKASVAGEVVTVDRLLCVEPVENTRYAGEVGHVVIGRVLKVDQSRWVVDIQARLDAYLPLSSVNLPAGDIRRRGEDDERNMRQYLKVIIA